MRGLLYRLALLGLALGAAPLSAQDWTRGHGGPDQAGFADIDTDPITDQTPVLHFPVPGPFLPGYGPIVAPNGTVYMAKADGTLLVMATNGVITTIAHPGRRAYTGPILGEDSSLYFATSDPLTRPDPRDHRTARAWLDKYTFTGTLIWEKPLPVHIKTSGAAVALNALGTGAGETILVAGREALLNGGAQVNLVGFDRKGSVLFSQDVGGTPGAAVYGGPGEIELDAFCAIGLFVGAPYYAPPCELHSGTPYPRAPDQSLPSSTVVPMPIGIAVAADGTIVVTDGYRGIRGYSYVPGNGVTKSFEKIDDRNLTTIAAVLPSQHSIYGVDGDRIAYAGPASQRIADILQDPRGSDLAASISATPTRLADGRSVTIGLNGMMTIVSGVTPSLNQLDAGAQTIAPVAASRTEIYASVVTGLVSFDAASGAKSATFALAGGLYPPAISASGRVYVLTDSELLVFLAKKTSPVRGTVHTGPVHTGPVRTGPIPNIPAQPRQ